MNNPDNAVIVKDLYKTFKLPHEQHSGIKQVILNIFNRNKGYESQKVLNDISFEIKKGEFFGIVGRNGSGKSTLLKLLAGIYAPDKGLVQINGSLTPFIELGVGFNPELTGRENVFMNGALLGFDRNEMYAMYDDIVSFAELEKFMDQKLKNYSSGMQVRLAFSIAIRADTDILILDEVLAVGDANFQKKCYEYFRELKEKKKTVILVTHDMESVRRFADRAMMLESGKIKTIGSTEKVSNEYVKSNIDRRNVTKTKTDNQDTGKRIVEIKKVRLINDMGKSSEVIETGKPITFEIEYNQNNLKTLVPMNFGIGLHSEKNGYVFGYNTQMDSVPVSKKQGKIHLNINHAPLLPGEYYINVVCFEQDEAVPYEHIGKALTFTVIATGVEAKYRGIALIPHSWKNIQ